MLISHSKDWVHTREGTLSIGEGTYDTGEETAWEGQLGALSGAEFMSMSVALILQASFTARTAFV